MWDALLASVFNDPEAVRLAKAKMSIREQAQRRLADLQKGYPVPATPAELGVAGHLMTPEEAAKQSVVKPSLAIDGATEGILIPVPVGFAHNVKKERLGDKELKLLNAIQAPSVDDKINAERQRVRERYAREKADREPMLKRADIIRTKQQTQKEAY